MPWNEPGDPSKKKDPWTGRPKQTPPDLEALLRDLCKKIIALFKLKTLNRKANIIAKSLPAQLNTAGLVLITIICVLAWLAGGFFKVNAGEQAIITRFGQYNATLTPGTHWIFKPIEQYTLVNLGKVNKFSTIVDLLTYDNNKISADITINYLITNSHDYLFSTAKPSLYLQEITNNAVNRVLSQFTLSQLLTISDFSLQERLLQQLNALMSKHHGGFTIKSIDIQSIQAPEQLTAAFADVKEAKKDNIQLENQAKAYALQTEPAAKAEAHHLITAAKAYQQHVILKAKTEITRFLALLPAYEAAPSLTDKRLYLETLQAMMTHNKSTNPPIINPTTSVLTSPSTKNTVATTNLTLKTDNIPSSYNITGGYE